jgi:hypothetical protein
LSSRRRDLRFNTRPEILESRYLLAGTPVVSITNTTIIEGRSEQSLVQVSLSEVSDASVEVTYELSDITTQGSSDYVIVAERITIPAGQLSVMIPIITIDDVYDEPNEAFRLTLSNPVGAVLGQSNGIITIDDPDGTQLPLFETNHLAYLGAFGVPEGPAGSSSLEFGGNAITYNPASNSLFMASNTNEGLHVAEVAIPASLVSTGVLAEMTGATVLQPFVDLGRLLTTNAAGQNAKPVLSYEDLNLGGLLVADGGLTGAMYMGYDGAEPALSTHSHFRTTTLNLATMTAAEFTGLVDVRQSSTAASGRLRGGYMAAVPDLWKTWIGADFVTGASGLNRIQFSSAGPALFGLNATAPAGSSGDALVYYPEGNELQWSTGTSNGPLPIFNGTTKVEGVAFVPGTRSVIFIGSNGLSTIGYGLGSRFNDSARPYSGYHSQNGIYQYQIWAYDIEDFMAVRNGLKSPWSLQPTSVVNFDLPTPEPARFIGGTAYDAFTGRLYVSQKLAGPGQTPVIHVYQLGNATSGVSSEQSVEELPPDPTLPDPAISEPTSSEGTAPDATTSDTEASDTEASDTATSDTATSDTATSDTATSDTATSDTETEADLVSPLNGGPAFATMQIKTKSASFTEQTSAVLAIPQPTVSRDLNVATESATSRQPEESGWELLAPSSDPLGTTATSTQPAGSLNGAWETSSASLHPVTSTSGDSAASILLTDAPWTDLTVIDSVFASSEFRLLLT